VPGSDCTPERHDPADGIAIANPDRDANPRAGATQGRSLTCTLHDADADPDYRTDDRAERLAFAGSDGLLSAIACTVGLRIPLTKRDALPGSHPNAQALSSFPSTSSGLLRYLTMTSKSAA
jgi:hypothetical protein